MEDEGTTVVIEDYGVPIVAMAAVLLLVVAVLVVLRERRRRVAAEDRAAELEVLADTLAGELDQRGLLDVDDLPRTGRNLNPDGDQLPARTRAGMLRDAQLVEDAERYGAELDPGRGPW